VDVDGKVALFAPVFYDADKSRRTSIHFSLNHKVESHGPNDWSKTPFTLIGDFGKARKLNGNPRGFNPVDTWWEFGPAESFIIPDPGIVAPNPGLHVPVQQVDDVLTHYKSQNFQPADIGKLMEEMGRHQERIYYADPYSYGSIEQINAPYLKELQKLHDDPKLLASKEGQALAASSAHRAAADHMIAGRGYQVMGGDTYSWAGTRYGDRGDGRFTRLHKELGAKYYQHTGTPEHEISLALRELDAACGAVKMGEMHNLSSGSRVRQFAEWISESGHRGLDRCYYEKIVPLMTDKTAEPLLAGTMRSADNSLRAIRAEHFGLLDSIAKTSHERHWVEDLTNVGKMLKTTSHHLK
jgi:hypothetical protein